MLHPVQILFTESSYVGPSGGNARARAPQRSENRLYYAERGDVMHCWCETREEAR